MTGVSEVRTTNTAYRLGEVIAAAIRLQAPHGADVDVELVCRAPWLDDQRDVLQPWEQDGALLTQRVLAARRLSGTELASGVGNVELAIPAGAPPSAQGAISWFVRAATASGPDAEAEILVSAPREAFVADLERVVPTLERSAEVSVELAEPTVHAGASLSGKLVLTPEKDLKARTVSIALINTFMVSTQLVPPTRVDLAGGVEVKASDRRELPFTVAVPSEAPPSFSDHLPGHRLLPEALPPANYWEVRASVKAGRLFGTKTAAAPVHVFNG